MIKNYDVAIIGGGVTGTAIARRLSKFDLKIILIEKHEDLASETTKSNSGILHGGYAAPKGTLKCEMNVRSNPMFDQAYDELKFDFERRGSFIVALEEDEMPTLEKELKQGNERGIKGEIITDIKIIKSMEPHITDNVHAVYHCPSAGLIWPFGLAIALAENARQNGVEILLESPVSNIKKSNGQFKITVGNHEISSKYIVNAAGLYADKISNMVGNFDYTITPRKGDYIILDKSALNLNKILFPIPTEFSKGILVCPTTHGNTFVGPNSNIIEDKDDLSTSSAGLNEIIAGSRRLFPSVPFKSAITNFAGNRAISSRNGDFIIEQSKVDGFVEAAGICSPGLSSCLAIAERIEKILRNDVGVKLVEKTNYNPYRNVPIKLSDMNETQLNAAIKENPMWGRIICRCETVTEAEIVNAIHRPIRSTSLDMIKKRLRPGMGRCNGGFCAPRVQKILSRELKVNMEQITKNDKGSELVVGRTKNLKSIIWEGKP